MGKIIMFKEHTIQENELKNKSLTDLLKLVVDKQEKLTIQFQNGEEVIIQRKPKLEPLPVLKGTIPDGWKDAIYE